MQKQIMPEHEPERETEASEFFFSAELCSPAADASNLTCTQKQLLLHDAAKGFPGSREALECWRRRDLLQLICMYMGKERKYTGLPKSKLVDLLLKLVTRRVAAAEMLNPESLSGSHVDQQTNDGCITNIPSSGGMDEDLVSSVLTSQVNGDNLLQKKDMLSSGFAFSPHHEESQTAPARQRKRGRPAHVSSKGSNEENISFTPTDQLTQGSPMMNMDDNVPDIPHDQDASTRPKQQGKVGRPPLVNPDKKLDLSGVCRNAVCRAKLQPDTDFCKRCSCCICKKFDDNKDPSLWIVCTPPEAGVENSCGLSCHLECALSNRVAGVVNNEPSHVLLDGDYWCGSCGRITSLISCWRKQLLVARDARRVDIFCYRLSLSHRLFVGTEKYHELHQIVHEAKNILEAEVGPLTEGSVKLARCIVNRLSSSAGVQNLIQKALQQAEALHQQPSMNASSFVADKQATLELNEVTSSSILVTVKSEGYIKGDPVIGYRIWHRPVMCAKYAEKPTCVIPGNVIGKATISSLQPHTEYSIQVVPFTEKLSGEPFELRCSTTAIEVNRVDLNDPNADYLEIEPNFKVRNLSRSLHQAWGQEHQHLGVGRDIINSNHRGPMDKEMKVGKPVSMMSKVLESSILTGPAKAATEDGMERNKMMCPAEPTINFIHDKDDVERANAKTYQLEPTVELPKDGLAMGKVTYQALPPDELLVIKAGMKNKGTCYAEPTTKLITRRDLGGSFHGDECIGKPFDARVMEVEDVSDLENSHTSRREEMGVVSPDVSDSLQANNGMNGVNAGIPRVRNLNLNEANVRWAVQVRNTASCKVGASNMCVNGRSVGNLHGCFVGAINGCNTSNLGTPFCAAKSYEFCVKIIRWLECEGHLKADFRMKFLTWFSLKASDQERRIVNVFIDTLQDDPVSLAGQLMDTFGDVICSKSHTMMNGATCSRMWQ